MEVSVSSLLTLRIKAESHNLLTNFLQTYPKTVLFSYGVKRRWKLQREVEQLCADVQALGDSLRGMEGRNS